MTVKYTFYNNKGGSIKFDICIIRDSFNYFWALLGSRKRLLCQYLFKYLPGVLQKILKKEPGAGFYVSLLSGSFVHIFQRLYSTFIFIKHNLSYERYLKPMLLLKNVSWIYNKIWTKEPFSFRLPITAFEFKDFIAFLWVPCWKKIN